MTHDGTVPGIENRSDMKYNFYSRVSKAKGTVEATAVPPRHFSLERYSIFIMSVHPQHCATFSYLMTG